MVWRPDPSSPQALGVFVRAMGAPGDRNLVSVSVDGGLVLKAPLPGRDNDSVGLGFGYAKIGHSAVVADAQAQALAASTDPVRSAESFIELTYQYQIYPWWQVQPDVQYVVSPGANIADPDGSGHRVGNAVLLGLRTSVTFWASRASAGGPRPPSRRPAGQGGAPASARGCAAPPDSGLATTPARA